MSIEEVINAFDVQLRDPLILYAAAKSIDNLPEGGSRSLAACRAVTFFGLRDGRQFFYEPLTTFDEVLAVAESNARLHLAYAPRRLLDFVSLSFLVFPSAYRAPQGRLPMPRPGEQPVGHHAVSLAGWDDNGGSLGFANSWGRAWGDLGRGTISRAYWDAYSTEAWLMRRARWGPTAMTYQRLINARTDRDYAAVWGMENPRWRRRFKFNGRGHQLFLWETLSWKGGHVAEVLEVRDGLGLRLGWAELFHEPDNGTASTVVKEFFVWPCVRRQGYGTLLLDVVEGRARDWRSEQVVVYFHDFDAVLPVRGAGRTFLQRAGYALHWRPHDAPLLAARGYKAL